jgi:ribosomal protein L18
MAEIIQETGQGIGDMTRGIGLLIANLAELRGEVEDNTTATEKYREGIFGVSEASNSLLDNILPLIPIVGAYAASLLAVGENARITTQIINDTYDSTIALAKAQRAATMEALAARKALASSAYDSGIAAAKEANHIKTMTQILGHAPGVYNSATSALNKNTSSKGSNTKATDTLNEAEERLQDRFNTRSEKLNSTATALEREIGLLKDASKAVDDYATGIQANLLSALDLGAAWTGQFDKDGEKTGESWLTAFDKQIDLAQTFGNNLNKLKASGVDQTLIEELASLGAPVGNAIVTEMLDGGEGLIETLNNKWVDVQNTTKTLAQGLVPEFLIAGEMSAIETVNGLAQQLSKETRRLNKLGRNMAKPVGAKFKAQLLSDIASAIREVEAISTAARAEKVAAAERQQVALTNAAVAQALQNLVRSADARNGAPISPVNR